MTKKQIFISIIPLLFLISGCRLIRKSPEWFEVSENEQEVLIECRQGKPVGMRISNIGVDKIKDIKILRKGQFDFTTVERILEQLMTGKTDEKTKVLEIFNFVKKYRRQSGQVPPDETEPHDPVKYLTVYGYGICDDHAKVFYNLLSKEGIRARICGVKGHCLAEAYYDNSWHLFDTDYGKYYHFPGQDRIVSFAEVLESHDKVIDQSGGKIAGMLKGVYSKKASPSYHENYFNALGHRGLFTLYPGENVTFYHKGELGYYGDYRKLKSPRYSNAVFTRWIDLSNLEEIDSLKIVRDGSNKSNKKKKLILNFSSPFVGVCGEVSVYCVKQADLALYCGNKRVEFKEEFNSERNLWVYQGKIEKGIHGKYRTSLNLNIPYGAESSLSKIKTELITQCAPIFCPRLNPGENIIRVYSKSDDDKNPKLLIEPIPEIRGSH